MHLNQKYIPALIFIQVNPGLFSTIYPSQIKVLTGLMRNYIVETIGRNSSIIAGKLWHKSTGVSSLLIYERSEE